ncbi:MAG: BNR-4 repeat-containing protein [Myxococcales bacterium]|nr:BNR-4 repeat-containing protein [Myxococcales bacterium]MCB9753391.1 BNR-4 repeat-containing protein [Myxococcales bacterium]
MSTRPRTIPALLPALTVAAALAVITAPASATAGTQSIDSSAAGIGAPLGGRFGHALHDGHTRTFVVYPGGQPKRHYCPATRGDMTMSESETLLRYYDHNWNQWSAAINLGDAFTPPDSHSYPQLVQGGGGNLVVISGGHQSPLVDRRSKVPSWSGKILTAGEWTQARSALGDHAAAKCATYPNAFRSEHGSNGTLWVFWRQTWKQLQSAPPADPVCASVVTLTASDHHEPIYYAYSTDDGAHWSAPQLAIDPDPNGDADKWDTIYVDGMLHRGDELHIAFSNRQDHNKKFQHHYYARFNLKNKRFYSPTNVDLGATITQAEMNNSAYKLRYDTRPSPETPTPYAVAIGVDHRGRVNLVTSGFQYVAGPNGQPTRKTLSCACSEDPVPKRMVRHVRWGAGSWQAPALYFVNSGDHVDPYEVRFDPEHDVMDLYYRSASVCATSPSCARYPEIALRRATRDARAQPVKWTTSTIDAQSQATRERFLGFGFVRDAPSQSPVQATYLRGEYVDWQCPSPYLLRSWNGKF